MASHKRAREELHRLQAARGARHLQAAGLPVAGDGACGARARVSGLRAISAPLAGAAPRLRGQERGARASTATAGCRRGTRICTFCCAEGQIREMHKI